MNVAPSSEHVNVALFSPVNVSAAVLELVCAAGWTVIEGAGIGVVPTTQETVEYGPVSADLVCLTRNECRPVPKLASAIGLEHEENAALSIEHSNVAPKSPANATDADVNAVRASGAELIVGGFGEVAPIVQVTLFDEAARPDAST